MTSQRAQIEDAAREALGLDALRPGQLEAIAAALEGHDVLAVMPTGAGKSAIYQLAAELIPGPTVVISPLIALQRDQVQALEESDAGAAAVANSLMAPTEKQNALDGFAAGDVEFLFLAPEQFANADTLEQVREARPTLFVVDEAHCVSSWGHDFRPDYLRLGAVIEDLGHPRVIALTATASPPVRSEIIAELQMRDPVVIVNGFDRPNIHLAVRTFHDEADKRVAMLEAVATQTPPGIVYGATRRHVEELAAHLVEAGVRAAPYHAGLKTSERHTVHEAFLNDEIDVVVATTAFGMGIDKPNVRFVFHYDVSDSLDSYYQEIGRAGRDGDDASALLFYRQEDLGLRRFFASGGRVGVDVLQQVAEAVERQDGPAAIEQLAEDTGLAPARLMAALNRLEKVGAVEVLSDGEVAATPHGEALGAAEEAAEAENARRSIDQSRVEMMRTYAETRDCRRQFLLNYFGEQFDDPCPSCDNCAAGTTIEERPETQPYAVNGRVAHDAWGEGLVVRYEGEEKLVVLFDTAGYKTLSVPMVVDNDLLTPLDS